MSGYGGEELTKQLATSPDASLAEKPFSRQALLVKIVELLEQ
jgi:hypothetical protein